MEDAGATARRAKMHELFGEDGEDSHEISDQDGEELFGVDGVHSHEILDQDGEELFGADGVDSHEILDQDEEEQHEIMDDDEDLFGVDQLACEEMMQNGSQNGLEFENRERLFIAYQAFAKVAGFCVSTRNTRDKYLMISCERARKPNVKKYTKKINCPARLNAIKQDNGKWKVSKVCNEHNHELEPHLSEFMPAHRHLSTNLKVHLDAYDRAGLRLCKSVRMMEVLAGGPPNLGASMKDCRNYVDKMRRLRLGDGDAAAIQQLFKRLQQNDRDFFYLLDIDDDSRLRHVMWIHPRSRAAYHDFHDVVSFDTTYLVNQYNMPFGTVVGVNHHHQSILLGCCLLSDECADSFKWFFRNWLDAMGGVQPTAILSDQDESITIALREMLPDSIHRYCLWHIVSKSSKKFKGVANIEMACADFNRVIHGSFNIREFEESWVTFQVKHNLQENSWLKDLYEIRQSWVPIYSTHIFWAGMMSTQRSESMHAFFDHYINSRSTLKTFVEQYEICVMDKIRKEFRAEYSTKCRPITCVSQFKWEAQFAKVYTNSVMELFQKEVKKIWNCNLRLLESVGSIMDKYEIIETRTLSKYSSHIELHFIVEHRPAGGYFECNCKKFESKGILCCHILKLLMFRNMEKVNERYILWRWRKDVYRPHFSISFVGAYPHMSKEYKLFQEMEREFVKCSDLAIDSEEKINFVKNELKEIERELRKWTHASAARFRRQNSSQIGETDGVDIPILDPLVVIRKGRPRTNRFKDPAEIKRGRGRGRGRPGGRGRASEGDIN